MVVTRHQYIGQNHSLMIANKSENVRYHSVDSLLSFRLLPKGLKIKIHKLYFYLFFCMGVKLGISH
jgi:hypothetical protein